MGKSICLWGKCYGVDRVIEMCQDSGIHVLAILDNNPAKCGSRVLGCETVLPQRLKELDPEYILVISMAFDAIIEQATGMGYPVEHIINYHTNPQEALQRLGGEYTVYHYDYDLDDQQLNKSSRKYRVRGKVIKEISPTLPLEQQRQCIGKLLEAFISARQDIQNVTKIYQVGENWDGILSRAWNSFYEISRSRKIEKITEKLGNFCRNSLSKAIMGGEEAFLSFAKNKSQEPWLQHNLEVWIGLVDGKATIEEAAMPPIGNPYGYDVEGHIINWNSFVNHGRAFRCLRLLEDQTHPVVAEIGGGFGGFAYNLLRKNRPLTYINFDLPENLLISSYYLSMAFPEKKILLYDSSSMPLDRIVLEEYDAVMMPNFMLPYLQDKSVELFINTISFSEMEYDTICEYFFQIDRIGARYFYHENLACHPEYKGYPSVLFPNCQNFRQLFASFSPWQGFDAYALGHSYLERLFERCS